MVSKARKRLASEAKGGESLCTAFAFEFEKN
jgi:hypothetical protein